MYESTNQIYQNFDYLFLTRFHQLDIPFSKNWRRVAINLSGGADSALLTFLLAKIIQDNQLECKIEIITFIRCWETRPWQEDIALSIYYQLKSQYPKIIGERHTAFIPPEIEHGRLGNISEGRSGDQIIVGGFNRYMAARHQLDAIFNATSLNPDDSRPDRMRNRDLDPKQAKTSEIILNIKEPSFTLCHPFRYVKKDWIVAQYQLLEQNDLYQQTRSCEGDFTRIQEAWPDFKNYHKGQNVPLCNDCFWCSERKWAESALPQTIKLLREGI